MKFKDLMIGVLLIVVLLFLFKEPDIEYQDKIIVETDTFTVVDTIFVDIVETVDVDEIQIDTAYVSNNNDTITVYNNPIGLQYGTINIITHTTGIIKQQSATFELRFPQTTHTRVISTTKVLPYRFHSLYLGVGGKVGINQFQPSIAVGGSISYKSHLLQYHYDNRGIHWIGYHRQFELKLPIWKRPFNF